MNKNVLIIGGIIIIACLIIIIYMEYEKSKLTMSLSGAAFVPIRDVTVKQYYVTNNVTVQNSGTKYSIEKLSGEQVVVGENNVANQNTKIDDNV